MRKQSTLILVLLSSLGEFLLPSYPSPPLLFPGLQWVKAFIPSLPQRSLIEIPGYIRAYRACSDGQEEAAESGMKLKRTEERTEGPGRRKQIKLEP